MNSNYHLRATKDGDLITIKRRNTIVASILLLEDSDEVGLKFGQPGVREENRNFYPSLDSAFRAIAAGAVNTIIRCINF